MTEREDVVEAVARAIKSAPTMDKAAQAAITAATPFIERALLEKLSGATEAMTNAAEEADITDYASTDQYYSDIWDVMMKQAARDLGYDIGAA